MDNQKAYNAIVSSRRRFIDGGMNMRDRVKKFVLSVLLGVIFISSVALAATQNYKTYQNGDFSISCYISCTANQGVGKTKGAPTGYYNRATILIYNANGYSLGSSTVHGRQEAVASKTDTGDVYSAKSCHLVADDSFNSVMPLYQQVQLVESR